MSKGTVYILLNPKYPDLIKIGRTARDPHIRARELSRESGVPANFIVIYDEIVDEVDRVESELHQKFAGYRVDRNKEFFSVRPTDAIKALQQMAVKHRIDFEDAHRSRNFLSELIDKYSQYLRQDIREVRIVHNYDLCLLETQRAPYDDIGDEIIERVDLDIFADSPFVTERTPDENADEFISWLDPYDIIMTTNLFAEEACHGIAEEYEGQQRLERDK